jgi:hypothetical protein
MRGLIDYRRKEETAPDETCLEIFDLPSDILCNFRVMAENEVGASDALVLKKFLRIHKNLSEYCVFRERASDK